MSKKLTLSAGKQVAVFLAALLLVLGSFGSAKAEEPIDITLGYQSLWAGVGEIFETLKHTNILELNGLEGAFETFTYGGPLGEAAVAGRIDNAMGADVPVLRVAGRQPGFVIISRTHDWRWGVLVRPDFEGDTLADLRGAKLAAPFGTTVFPRTIMHLVEAGIEDPFRDMTIINQDIAEQIPTLQAKAVDAVSSWDPTVAKLLDQGLARMIYENAEGEGPAWQGLSGAFMEKYGEDGAVRFLKSYIMAIWWASNNIDKAHAWFAETSRMPTDLLVVAQMADRYLREPVKSITDIDLSISDADVVDTQRVMDFLLERKLLANHIDVASKVDNTYVLKAQEEIAAGDLPSLDKIAITD